MYKVSELNEREKVEISKLLTIEMLRFSFLKENIQNIFYHICNWPNKFGKSDFSVFCYSQTYFPNVFFIFYVLFMGDRRRDLYRKSAVPDWLIPEVKENTWYSARFRYTMAKKSLESPEHRT